MVDLIGIFVELLVFVVVFLGNDCNRFEYIYIDVDCDYFVEQLFLIISVDNIYIVLLNMDNRDIIICIVVIENINIIFVIGGVIYSWFLYKFDYFNIKILSSQICLFELEIFFLVIVFGLYLKRLLMGDLFMIIVFGINQYIDYYKIFVILGYDYNYFFIMIENLFKDLFCVNSLVVEISDIVFEDNVLVCNILYNVRIICVIEGEFIVFILNRECFGLIVVGVVNFKVYGFLGNLVFLQQCYFVVCVFK